MFQMTNWVCFDSGVLSWNCPFQTIYWDSKLASEKLDELYPFKKNFWGLIDQIAEKEELKADKISRSNIQFQKKFIISLGLV